MNVIETRPREIGFVLWGHCQNLLDDPRKLSTKRIYNVLFKHVIFGNLVKLSYLSLYCIIGNILNWQKLNRHQTEMK